MALVEPFIVAVRLPEALVIEACLCQQGSVVGLLGAWGRPVA